jgi:hypothetical protein
MIDPDLPAWQQALARIQIELMLEWREHPEMTPRQALQEARRRAAKPMLDAVDAMELDARRRRAQRYGG